MPLASRLLIGLAVLALTGCPGVVRQAPPQTVERVIEVPVKTYVPIDKDLTRRAPIAKGPLSKAPMVARERRKALEQCYIQLGTIEKIQGTPVPEAKP